MFFSSTMKNQAHTYFKLVTNLTAKPETIPMKFITARDNDWAFTSEKNRKSRISGIFEKWRNATSSRMAVVYCTIAPLKDDP